MVGTTLDRVEEVDLDYGEVEWRKFMHINIDITKSLLRWKKLNIGTLEPVWLQFTYERLSDFCFCYGVLGHGHKDCRRWTLAHEKYDQEGLPYGNEL